MTGTGTMRGTGRTALLTWVPVTAEGGRVRLEMRWHVADRTAPGSRAAA